MSGTNTFLKEPLETPYRSTTSEAIVFEPDLGDLGPNIDVIAWWYPFDRSRSWECLIQKRPGPRKGKPATVFLVRDSKSPRKLELPAFLRWFNDRFNGLDGDLHTIEPALLQHILGQCVDRLENKL